MEKRTAEMDGARTLSTPWGELEIWNSGFARNSGDYETSKALVETPFGGARMSFHVEAEGDLGIPEDLRVVLLCAYQTENDPNPLNPHVEDGRVYGWHAQLRVDPATGAIREPVSLRLVDPVGERKAGLLGLWPPEVSHPDLARRVVDAVKGVFAAADAAHPGWSAGVWKALADNILADAADQAAAALKAAREAEKRREAVSEAIARMLGEPATDEPSAPGPG